MRYKITLSYDGAAFCGWQIQPGSPSVQETLQDALSTLLAERISVTGAGRTDTGVNAVGYAAHFDCSRSGFDARDICYKLNAILPSGVVVHEIVPVTDDFHARFGARRREYAYFIHRGKDIFLDRKSYRCPYPLDLGAMREAASRIVGKRDFSCFEKTGGNNKTSVCDVFSCTVETYIPGHAETLGYPYRDGDYIVIRIAADRFLRNMVRAVAGTLVEIGRGRRPVEWIDQVLASGDRCSAGESVPGYGLYLYKVEY